MKEIPLTQGKVALVDNEDYDWLMQWKWCYANGYAVRTDGKRPNRRQIYMHREILGTPDEMDTDHANRNRLDNRRKNLRESTPSQNASNTSYKSKSSSGYRGVASDRGKWRAGIRHNNTNIFLGRFNTALDAALAYDEAARFYHGEYARTNF